MESKLHLEPLTPVILDEKEKQKLVYDSYSQAFDMVFANDDLCNIALSGPYGAGKSTLLGTYEAEHPDKKCIHISLARFGDDRKLAEEGVAGNGRNEKQGRQRELEIKTLNQLIHQISPKLIPQTQFRIKEEVRLWKVISYTVALFVLLVSGGYLLWAPKAQWDKASGITLFDSFWKYWGNIAALVVLLIALGYLTWSIVSRQLVRPLIKSIHVDKSQIDLVEDESETSEHQFDRYMDEIIYLFRKGGIDALVLEDMDRFDNIDIFNELREINFLINRRYKKEKRNKRKAQQDVSGSVKFIYMVKDELFENFEQRTKFFDLMIPVVPVMDNSNSYDLLVELLDREYGWRSKLDERYLKKICLFVRDYRVLKNIYNEYQIYYCQLRGAERDLSPTKLFAMVTYKNLWPLDYADLQRRKGVVYQILAGVEERRKKLIEGLRTDIGILEEEVRAKRAEAEAESDDLRREALERGISEGKAELESLREEVKKAKQDSLAELLQWESAHEKLTPIEEILGKENVTEYQRLAGYFLQDGMIAEDYAQYMTYFYPYSLTEKERLYLNRVYVGKNVKEQLTIELENPEEVREHLRPADYRSAALPNNNLLGFLLKKKDTENIRAFVSNLKLYENTGFVSEYIPEEGCLELWMGSLAVGWQQVISRMIEDAEISKEKKLKFLVNCLEYARPEQIEHQLLESPVLMFWKENEGELIAGIGKKGLEALYKTGVSLSDIGKISWEKEKWEYVYQNNLYYFNRENLSYIFQNEYRIEVTPELWRGCYRTIASQEAQSLALCVEEHIEEFLGDFYLPECAEEADGEELVLLLNRKNVKEADKRKLMDKSKAVIKCLSDLEDTDVWTYFLENDRVAFDRENIMAYWKLSEEIDEPLRNFLVKHFQTGGCQLSFEYMLQYLGEPENNHPKTNTLLRQLLNLEGMGDGYRTMLMELHVWYSKFPWSQVTESQIGDLVAANIIQMTSANLKSMREREDMELLSEWISMQPDTYCKLMEDETLRVEDELHELLDCSNLDESTKEKLVGYCGKPIQVKTGYNSGVISAILNADLLGGGYSALFNRYEHRRYSKELVGQIEEYWILNVKKAQTLKTKIPDTLLRCICRDERVLETDKKVLITAQTAFHDRAAIEKLLELLEEDQYLMVLRGQQGRIAATETDRHLLEALLQKGWIFSYKAEGDEYMITPGKKRRLRKSEKKKEETETDK